METIREEKLNSCMIRLKSSVVTHGSLCTGKVSSIFTDNILLFANDFFRQNLFSKSGKIRLGSMWCLFLTCYFEIILKWKKLPHAHSLHHKYIYKPFKSGPEYLNTCLFNYYWLCICFLWMICLYNVCVCRCLGEWTTVELFFLFHIYLGSGYQT